MSHSDLFFDFSYLKIAIIKRFVYTYDKFTLDTFRNVTENY